MMLFLFILRVFIVIEMNSILMTFGHHPLVSCVFVICNQVINKRNQDIDGYFLSITTWSLIFLEDMGSLVGSSI